MNRLQTKLKISIILYSLVIMTACSREYYDITYKGQILDADTHKPIDDCEIRGICYYQKNIDQLAYEEAIPQWDKNGRFTLHFSKGFKIKLRLSSENYLDLQEVFDLSSSTIEKQLFLRRKSKTNDLRAFFNTDETISENTPYLRERFYKNDSSLISFRSNEQTFGYDFINGNNVTNLNEADLWISKIDKNFETIILKSSANGGIHPIFKDEIKNNIWNEFTQAPLNGYTNEYLLTGDEIGFFIKCRDGIKFAKIMHDPNICIRRVNNGLSSFIEQGIRFDYLFQSNPQKANIFLLYQ